MRDVCSSSRIAAPALRSSEHSRSAIRSSAISVDSFVHRIELSNALDSTRHWAAWPMSALASTNAGTFPGPTPSAGLPE